MLFLLRTLIKFYLPVRFLQRGYHDGRAEVLALILIDTDDRQKRTALAEEHLAELELLPMVYRRRIFVIEYHHEAVRLQGSLQIERVGSYLFPLLPALVAGAVWIEIDCLIYGRRSEELVYLCHEVVVILGQEGKELLDDVETPAVIFLLGNDERLEVTRVVSHVERFVRIVM